MPTESLTAALQTLREDYIQKQKATQSLIAAIKGKSSAFGKVQQAISDYAAQNANSDPMLESVQEAIGAAQENVNPLTTVLGREAKSLTTFTGALKGAMDALSTHPVDVVRLSHPVEALKTSDIQDERLLQLLPELTHELEEAQEALGVVFGAALRAALTAQGIAVTGTSPQFEVGRFEIAANFLSRSASISYGKEIVVKRVPLSIEAILKAYQGVSKSITGRKEDGEVWIRQFYTAWELARAKRNTEDKRANIVDCYFEMVLQRQAKTFFTSPTKSVFADYTRAQFAYDLFELAIRPQRSYNGTVVYAHAGTRSQTDKGNIRSMWIVEGAGPHDGRYIGDIVFDKNE
ncbi:MAG: hypothetical protein ABI947_14820 [Chloroflexota bacterium]